MENISIVIPTHNRPKYLYRALSYYNSVPITCSIFIADSSSSENKKENAKVIASFPGMSIFHLDKYEGTNALDAVKKTNNQYLKIADALHHVKTPYSVLCADDDFTIPNAIQQAIMFLEDNPDFVCAHGHYLSYYVKQGWVGWRKKFCWTPLPATPDMSNTVSDVKERLLFQFSHFTYPAYAVYKTEVLRKVFQESGNTADDYRFGETLLSLLTAVYGKIKFLDILYAVREFDMLSSGGYSPKNTFQYFIKQGTYKDKYKQFREKLALYLKDNSALSLDDARKTVDDGMEVFMKKRFYSFQNKILSKIRDWLDRVSLPNLINKKIQKVYRDIFLYKRLYFYKERFVYNQRKKNNSFSKELEKVKKYVLTYPVDKRV